MTKLLWDTGTAYDFFVSLFVLHYADEFGLRPSWAAGVRQRLSSPQREFLVHLTSFAGISLAWVLGLARPKDVATALQAVADLAPADRLPALTLTPETPPEVPRSTVFQVLIRRGACLLSTPSSVAQVSAFTAAMAPA